MELINIEQARKRLALRRHHEAQDRAGEWIGRNPMLSDICARLITFDPILGEDVADENQKRRALSAAVEQGVVTLREVALLDAAIARAREIYPDT